MNWRKIWYGLAISLSAIVLLVSAAGIIGVWLVEGPLSRLTSVVLDSVGNSAGAMRTAIGSIDQKLEQMQSITGEFSNSVDQLSQSVTDTGVIMVLLPEEKEQNLREIGASARTTFEAVSNTLSTSLALYRSIDQLPFVSLPSPSKAQVEEARQTLDQIQTAVDELQKNTAQFRAGVSGQVDRLRESIDQVALKIGDSRDRLATLDARLTRLQESAEQLKRTFQTAIMVFSVFITLALIYVIYTQVEIIRLFAHRWQQLNANSGMTEGAEKTT